MSPPNTAAAYAALQVIREEPERCDRVLQLAERVRAGLAALGFDTGASQTPIVPIMVGARAATLSLWRALMDAGVFTNPVLPPAAPAGLLRTSYSAIHTEASLDEALEAFAWAGRRLGIIPAAPAGRQLAALELG
jgi:7-keto-8-aminopelargonate synthetase-like enzyme